MNRFQKRPPACPTHEALLFANPAWAHVATGFEPKVALGQRSDLITIEAPLYHRKLARRKTCGGSGS